MESVIKELEEKIKMCGDKTKESRARKGAYVDALLMARKANGIKPPLCDAALTNEDKDLFTAIMGKMLDIKEKPGTLCFCMEEILKHFDVKRKRDFA